MIFFSAPGAAFTTDAVPSATTPAGFLSTTDAAFGPDVAAAPVVVFLSTTDAAFGPDVAAVAGRYPTGLSRASARSREDLMVAIFGTDSGRAIRAWFYSPLSRPPPLAPVSAPPL